jgi:hypothetical protein
VGTFTGMMDMGDNIKAGLRAIYAGVVAKWPA